MPEAFNIDLQITQSDFTHLIDALGSSVDEAIETAKMDAAKTLKNLVLGGSPVGIRKKKEGESRLKWSWSEISKVDDGSLTFGTPAPYATVLETGSYPGVGPRTIEVGEGIFSRQAPGGMIAPILDTESVIDDIIEQIGETLKKGVEDATAGNVY